MLRFVAGGASVLVAVACSGGAGGEVLPDSRPLPPPPAAVCTVPVALDTRPADRMVGDGTPASCTDAALRTAIAAGGKISFACGAAATTITLNQSLDIGADVVVDGGGLITISGGDAVRVFAMDTGNFEATSPHLWLQRVTVAHGKASGALTAGGGGAVYYVGGKFTAIDSDFIDNAAELRGPDVAGGAIYGIGRGESTVVGCRFSGNRASNGGAIGALGSGLTIVNSVLVGNTATGQGANSVENGVQVGEGGNGGAVSMDGQGRDLDICGSTFDGNSSGAFGGAVFRTGYQTERNEIHRSSFINNVARDRTDAMLPSGAGALYLQGVNVTMTGTTIANNQARSSAGVWILGHGNAPARANFTNVTITGNQTYARTPFTERGVAAGLTVGDNTTGTLLNVTIVNNQAQFGAGIWQASPLLIKNSIIANLADNQYTPLNCSGRAYAMPPAMGDHNVQWPVGPKDDMDCTAGITRVDPVMGPLGDRGGPTATMVPTATGLPRGVDCPAIDQRGMPRNPQDCAIGAVEQP